MTMNGIRKLIWIPIVHTQADLGSMAGAVRRLHIQKVGRHKWEQRRQAVENSWADIRLYVEGLDLPWTQVRLYQDGLPVCGHEREIVESLAQAGSLNHQLLLELVNKGATLVGTESPQLLREEYELAGQTLKTLNAGRPDLDRRQQQRGQTLLQERDLYIGARIDQTLAPGDTGLLFLGLLHALPALPADIEVLRQTSAFQLTRTRTTAPPTSSLRRTDP